MFHRPLALYISQIYCLCLINIILYLYKYNKHNFIIVFYMFYNSRILNLYHLIVIQIFAYFLEIKKGIWFYLKLNSVLYKFKKILNNQFKYN